MVKHRLVVDDDVICYKTKPKNCEQLDLSRVATGFLGVRKNDKMHDYYHYTPCKIVNIRLFRYKHSVICAISSDNVTKIQVVCRVALGEEQVDVNQNENKPQVVQAIAINSHFQAALLVDLWVAVRQPSWLFLSPSSLVFSSLRPFNCGLI